MGPGILFAILISSLGAAALAVAVIRARPPAAQAGTQAGAPVALLVDGGEIVDATSTAQALLDPGSAPGWTTLATLLGARFPDFPASAAVAEAQAPLHLSDSHGSLTIVAQEPGVLHLSLDDPAPDPVAWHRAALRSREFEAMRAASDLSPHPSWQVDATGRVIWANAAYRTLARDTRAWTEGAALPRLFDLHDNGGTPQRVSLALPDDTACHSFDVVATASGATRIGLATNVDAVVKGESAQRTFVQTLTKIFAQLSVGLAVFDRERNLALFNPALLDLTGLPAERLSARPSLPGFFDMLREAQVMPEPRDYAAWRTKLAQLARAGGGASYSDTWSLSSGLVYRVSGRPQPDGAFAVLIEDVTSEISLTRRFRTDLELGQGVLDSLDAALAVFSPQGVLVLTNAAYRALWGVDPDTSLRETTRCEALGLWQDGCRTGTDWGALRDALAARGDAVRWQGCATLRDGRELTLRALPLPGGAALVLFGQPARRPPVPNRAPANRRLTADPQAETV